MELKPGYKQTEVGVIPEDWSEVPITELLEAGSSITYGVVQPGPTVANGVLFIRGGDIYDGSIIENGLRTISKQVSSQYERTILKGGELLVSLVGYPGEAAIVPAHLAGANIARQVALVRLDNSNDGTTEYACWFLRSTPGKKLLLKEAIGSAQKVINLRDISRFSLPLPGASERRSITFLLDDIDAFLSSCEQALDKKRNIKQAAMQELLTGKRRLPGFEGEWEEISLGSVASMNSGGTPPTGRDDFYGGGIPWVSISDMTSGGKFISQTERTLSVTGLANCAAKQFPAGTILYAMYASLGECSIAAAEVTSSQAILGIRPGASLHNEFLFYYLSSIHEKVKLMGQQGTQSNLNKGIVQGFTLRLPDKAEQIAIAEALGEIDQELDALSMKAQKVREMKAGMMQQLLTGKIRLKDPGGKA